MVDAKSRAKVRRLFGSDFRAGDLTDLFLFSRDHCDGRQSVRDIGDFVAHHNERDRGIITQSTRDWFAVVRFHMPSFFPSNAPKVLDFQRMPSATKDYFKIAVNRLDARYIKEKTGLKRQKAHELMKGIIERLIHNADGTWTLNGPFTSTEHSLINCVCSQIVVKPAFDVNRLSEEFFDTLKSNGLLTKEEAHDNKESLMDIVQLFSVAVMHNCIVQIGDGTTTKLKAQQDSLTKHISVNATIQRAIPNMPNINFTASMFTANLDPVIHCSPDLLAMQDWDFEIELAPNRRLSRLE